MKTASLKIWIENSVGTALVAKVTRTTGQQMANSSKLSVPQHFSPSKPFLQTLDKIHEQRRLQKKREKKAEYSPKKVRQMVNIVTAAPRCVRTVPQVQHPKNEPRNRNRDEKHHNPDGGVEQNGREQHRRHRARSPDAGKTRRVFILHISRRRCRHDCPQIKDEVQSGAEIGEQILKKGFHILAEEIQRQHIENQVHRVAVQKPAREPAVVLAAPRLLIRPVFHLHEQLLVVESHERDEASESDNDVRDGHALLIWLLIWLCSYVLNWSFEPSAVHHVPSTVVVRLVFQNRHGAVELFEEKKAHHLVAESQLGKRQLLIGAGVNIGRKSESAANQKNQTSV